MRSSESIEQFVVKALFPVLAVAVLCACSDGQQAQAGAGGDINASSLTFHSKTPSDDDPVSTPLEITGISCDGGSETAQTRVDLGEEGHVLVRNDPRGSMLIEVDLARLDILGGKREHLYPDRDEVTLALERNGSISGHYQFRLFGELEGMYVVEMDIQC